MAPAEDRTGAAGLGDALAESPAAGDFRVPERDPTVLPGRGCGRAWGHGSASPGLRVGAQERELAGRASRGEPPVARAPGTREHLQQA